MTVEEKELKETKNRRIRRVKRWLRPLPRRATVHRYPVLGWFANTARKRIYLWSFRTEQAVPALYAGFILTLLPIYGIQLPLALLLALVLRANLPILAGLQIISNPFTVIPIWFALYQIGRHVMSLLGVHALPLRKAEVSILIDNVNSGEWGTNIERILSVFGLTSLGALIVGTFFGVASSMLYRAISKRTAKSYEILHQKIEARKKLKVAETNDADA